MGKWFLLPDWEINGSTWLRASSLAVDGTKNSFQFRVWLQTGLAGFGGKGVTSDLRFFFHTFISSLYPLSALTERHLLLSMPYSQCGCTRLVVAAETSSMFQMVTAGTGTDGEGAPRTTMMTWNQRNWHECLWLSLTMTPCPCLQIRMLLMKSCHSRRARSSR